MIVVDAPVLANALGVDDEDGRTARDEPALLSSSGAPDLIDVETVTVPRKQWLTRTISNDRFATALDDLQEMDFDRVLTARTIRRAGELRANVTFTVQYIVDGSTPPSPFYTALPGSTVDMHPTPTFAGVQSGPSAGYPHRGVRMAAHNRCRAVGSGFSWSSMISMPLWRHCAATAPPSATSRCTVLGSANPTGRPGGIRRCCSNSVGADIAP